MTNRLDILPALVETMSNAERAVLTTLVSFEGDGDQRIPFHAFSDALDGRHTPGDIIVALRVLVDRSFIERRTDIDSVRTTSLGRMVAEGVA